MKSIFHLTLLLVFMTGTVFGKSEKVTIKTSAKCEMCKERIEGAIGELEGVDKVLLDVASKNLTVKYDNERTTDENIRTAVASLGYDADGIKRNEQAHASLPNCCKTEAKTAGCCAGKAGAKSCSKSAAKSCDSKAKASCDHKAGTSSAKPAGCSHSHGAGTHEH